MVTKNRLIADMFEQIADVLEFKSELPFKVNAYRKAARVIGDLQEDIEQVWREGRLDSIPGIGKGMREKIEEFLASGRMSKYEEVMKDVPAGLLDLLKIQNLGPKTLALAHRELGVNNLEDLKRVIEDGSLAALPGMGPKKVENIRKGLELFQTAQERISLGVALPIVEEVISLMKQRAGDLIGRIHPAGSLRRMRETVGDIDVLAETDQGARVVQTFVSLPIVERVLAAGDTKGSVIVQGGVQVDLRAVPSDSYGSALQYFTGSKAHNVHLRDIAKRRGLKISEYGIFDVNRDEKLGGRDEEEIYRIMGMEWIPPELREDRGEIEAAAEGKLPHLVELSDLKGDLHVHTKFSDGAATIEQMVEAAKKLGYVYLGICDHSRTAKYARGLEIDTLLKQLEEIQRLNDELDGFRILAGTEVDILADGTLDFPDEILERLDIVIASIHSGFKQNVTERMIRAMENPHVDIVAHPTGRLISKREGYEVDVDKVLDAAAATRTALEINAFYDRLDLSDLNARRAAEKGILLAINTDSHHPDHLWMIRFGVGTARRAWLGPENVLNCLPLDELLRWLREHKQ
ncbi:MAG: DNA polymerase/3'-5' exonuclease PolX [candidate division KSB1 bacterium]|nr:DNA polymerase/3'-5' exonuclease PolX [candidate division KSB1 bacterium]